MLLKHVGRMVKNKRRVVVAYHVVPNEPTSSIVITTENLMADEHDSLMKLVESPAGQQVQDLAIAMSRTPLPDGSNMLARFHSTGKMVKVKSSDVEMTPTTTSTILLSELNQLIAAKKGVSVADLALSDPSGKKEKPRSLPPMNFPKEEPVANTVIAESMPDVLSDEQIATRLRAQAESLLKEAESLTKQADELSPTLVKPKVVAKKQNSAPKPKTTRARTKKNEQST